MSILEWFGELFDPGPRGTIEVEADLRPSGATGGQVLLQLGFAAAMVGGGLWLAFGPLGVPRTHENIRLAAGGIALYLLLGFILRPRPDRSNMGWSGTWLDDPFRASDDWNRSLSLLGLLLLPGRFVAECLVDAAVFPFRGAGTPRPRRATTQPRGRWRRTR